MRGFHHKFILTLAVLSLFAQWTQAQTPRRYLIKPYNLGATTDVHARSVRSIQVRVTDENDHPVPDVPVLFSLLSAGGAGGAGGAGTLAGGLTFHAVTNAEGLAAVEFQAGPMTGATGVLQAQVEGTDAVWQTTLNVIKPKPASAKQNDQGNGKQGDNNYVNNDDSNKGNGKETEEEKKSSQKKERKSKPPLLLVPFAKGSEKYIGHLPKDDLVRRQFTTLSGDRTSLQAMRGQVVVMHFFGSWCGYSKAQARVLHQLTEHGLPPGLRLIGMSVKDPRSNPELVKRYIAEQLVLYQVVDPVDDKAFVQFVNSRDISVPQTLIYDADGKLVAHYNGYSKEINESIIAIIKDLTNGKE